MNRTVNHTSKEVQSRFFDAIQILIAEKKLRGLKTFCDRYSLNRIKYSNLRSKINTPEKERASNYVDLDTEALVHLCKDFDINTEWLLLGRGRMRNGNL